MGLCQRTRSDALFSLLIASEWSTVMVKVSARVSCRTRPKQQITEKHRKKEVLLPEEESVLKANAGPLRKYQLEEAHLPSKSRSTLSARFSKSCRGAKNNSNVVLSSALVRRGLNLLKLAADDQDVGGYPPPNRDGHDTSVYEGSSTSSLWNGYTTCLESIEQVIAGCDATSNAITPAFAKGSREQYCNRFRKESSHINMIAHLNASLSFAPGNL